MTPAIGLTLRGVAAMGRGDLAPPDWPEGAVALWLILGQSNAEGWAPWRQDPARSDPGQAAALLTPEERAFHPWLRLSTQGDGANAGQFPNSSQGIATDGFPRSSGKVYAAGNTLGVPAGTQSFGPEIGLVRHVLEGAAPSSWRDDGDPRLFLFKQTEGSRSVDFFRWGGEGQDWLLEALRQASGPNLTALTAAKTVLVQGAIFVIGERDANDDAPTGGSMGQTLAPRFADWVRQVRGAFGSDLPVAFCEVIEDQPDKVLVNGELAELAAGLTNAAVIEAQADWTDVGDQLHYDAQGQDRLGRAAFAHFRDAYGRPSDGLVTAFPFDGLKPWFHVPPLLIDDGGTQMRIAATASVDGHVHGLVTAHGAAPPDAQAIYDARGGPGAFQKEVFADVEATWFSGAGTFAANQTQDVHFVLRSVDGVLGEVARTTRGGNVKFAPDLAAGVVGSTTAEATLRPSFSGEVRWALHEGARDHMRAEDVEAMAFLPVQAGVEVCTVNVTVSLSLSGLTPGTTYTLFATGRRGSDGLAGVTQKVQFVTS